MTQFEIKPPIDTNKRNFVLLLLLSLYVLFHSIKIIIYTTTTCLNTKLNCSAVYCVLSGMGLQNNYFHKNTCFEHNCLLYT